MCISSSSSTNFVAILCIIVPISCKVQLVTLLMEMPPNISQFLFHVTTYYYDLLLFNAHYSLFSLSKLLLAQSRLSVLYYSSRRFFHISKKKYQNGFLLRPSYLVTTFLLSDKMDFCNHPNFRACYYFSIRLWHV